MSEINNFFNHKYPYENFHELNLDWVLSKINEFQKNLDDLEERVKQAAIDAAKEYVDEQVAIILSDFAELQHNVEDLTILFNQKTAEIELEFDEFTRTVQNQITLLNARIINFENTVQQEIIGINATTDEKIALNNQYLLQEMSRFLSGLKVLNYFTGEQISVQEMFDYLSRLHLENPITYTELASAGIDYTALAALNMTYTELAVKGKSFIIP